MTTTQIKIRMEYFILTGVARWVGCRPATIKGHVIDSQAGHMPGLPARFLVGGVQNTISRWF